jgi:hypothetical protein
MIRSTLHSTIAKVLALETFNFDLAFFSEPNSKPLNIKIPNSLDVARFCSSRFPNSLSLRDSKPFTKHKIYIPLIS